MLEMEKKSSQLLRLCLEILKCEVNNESKSEYNDREFCDNIAELTKCFVSCPNEIHGAISHVISLFAKLLSRLVPADVCHIKNSRPILCTLQSLNEFLTKVIENRKLLAQMILNLENGAKLLKRMIHLIIFCLESLRIHGSLFTSSAAAADEEEVAELSFASLGNILTLFRVWSACHDDNATSVEFKYFPTETEEARAVKSELGTVRAGNLGSVISPPALAQLVHSCLQFSELSNKRVAVNSFKCLLALQRHTHSFVEWREYVPGVFTALFNHCCDGKRRSSTSRSHAVLCLIEVLVCVGADSHPLNARCLPHPMHSNGELSSFGDIAKQFEQMRINSERKHVAEPQEVEWRPEFLQRIGAPFFSALMEVFPASSCNMKKQIVEHLHRMLELCKGFLGPVLFTRLLLLFIPGTEDSACEIQRCSTSALVLLLNREKRLERWQQASESLLQQLLGFVQSSSKLAEFLCGGYQCTGLRLFELAETDDEYVRSISATEFKLNASLTFALGCAKLIGQKLQHCLIVKGSEMLRCLQILFYPDIRAAKVSSPLESRMYYSPLVRSSSAAITIQGSYFRTPLLIGGQGSIINLARRLTACICFSGLLDVAAESLRRSVDKLHRLADQCDDTDAPSHSSIERSNKSLCCLISLFEVVNIAILAEYDLPVAVEKSSNNVEDFAKLSCGYCGLRSKSLCRCSKCRLVYYCNGEHQRLHWNQHKKTCSSHSNAHGLLSNATPFSNLESTGLNFDQLDPIDIPCSPQIASSADTFCLSKLNLSERQALGSILLKDAVKLDRSCVLRHFCGIVHSAVSVLHWYLHTGNCKDDGGPGLSQDILAAQASEVIANVAFSFGRSFRNLLQDVLFALMEMSVCENVVSRTAAVTSLSRIALYCGYENVKEMYRENIDYIVDYSSKALRIGMKNKIAVSAFSRTHLVISAVFDALGDEMFSNRSEEGKTVAPASLLRSMIADVLGSVDEVALETEGFQLSSLIVVLKTLAQRTLPPQQIVGTDDQAITANSSSILNSLLHYQKSLSCFDQNPELPNPSTETEHVDCDTDVGSEVEDRPEVGLELEILERCKYFLGAPDLKDRIQALEVISVVLNRLVPFRNALLPAIHKCWPLLLFRLRELRYIFVKSLGISSASYFHETNPVQMSLERVRLIFSARANESLQIIRLHMLPNLLEMFALLATLGKSFMSIKFKDDLWPEMLMIHFHIFQEELRCIDSDQRGRADPANRTSMTTLYEKIVLRLLRMWAELTKLHSAALDMMEIGSLVGWLMVPLLRSGQSLVLVEAAKDAISNILRSPAGIRLNSILRGAVALGQNQIWEAVATDASFVESLANLPLQKGSGQVCLAHTNTLRNMFLNDILLSNRVVSLLDNDLVVNRSEVWVQLLSRWETI